MAKMLRVLDIQTTAMTTRVEIKRIIRTPIVLVIVIISSTQIIKCHDAA